MENTSVTSSLLNSTPPALLNELIDDPRPGFASRFITTLVVFMNQPLRLYQLVQEKKFNAIVKPVPFFLSSFIISFVLFILAQYYYEPPWQEAFNKMAIQDKRDFSQVFTSKSETVLYTDTIGYAMHTRLYYFEKDISEDQIVNYLNAHKVSSIAQKVRQAYHDVEMIFWMQGFIIFTCILTLVIPWALLFHWLVYENRKNYAQNITHSLYMFGMFLIFAMPLVYLIDPYKLEFDNFWFAFFGACFYLFVQDLLILRKLYAAKTWRVTMANIIANSVLIAIIVQVLYLIDPEYLGF